jgi:transcriptional regulator with XRE-family HTH domain
LRRAVGLSQEQLGARLGLSQSRISRIENGHEHPDVVLLLQLAGALQVSIHRLLYGTDERGEGLRDIAIELHGLGLVDLRVDDARVPGASRRPEELFPLCVAEDRPNPRIIEAMPALLVWNEWSPVLLKAFAETHSTRALWRLGWLADVADFLSRDGRIPGKCHRSLIHKFLLLVKQPGEEAPWDDLGFPSREPPSSALWTRWTIRYEADLDQFQQRARELHEARTSRPGLASGASR